MELYVEEYGPHAAPTIVFLHGGGGANWTWQPQIDRLADYHCLAPTCLGMARAPRSTTPKSRSSPWEFPHPWCTRRGEEPILIIHPAGEERT